MEAVRELTKFVRISLLFCIHSIVGLLSWLIPRSCFAKRVDEEIVLITGAGSGLGRDIALEFARLKSDLVLWDINESGLIETKNLVEDEYAKRLKPQERPRECLIYKVDVSDREKIYAAAEQVKIDLNRRNAEVKVELDVEVEDREERNITVLVNNAGIYYGEYLLDLSDKQIEKIFDINILAHFWTVRTFLPDMIRQKKGHIVEIASMGGISGMFKEVDYCATKFATVGFEESLSIELNHLGLGNDIRTTVVCPFFFGSNLFSGFNDKAAPMMSSKYVAKEAVLTMRCNQTRVLLPKLTAYSLYVLRGFFTRSLLIETTKLYIAEGINNIVGHGSKIGSKE